MKPTSLRGIANKAASDKRHRFRNLFELLSVGFLLYCWRFVNLKAASGVDKQDAASYKENLQENVEELVEAVKGGGSIGPNWCSEDTYLSTMGN
jgi:RNA-directed DNA polymerase